MIPDAVRALAEDPAAYEREPAPASGFERLLSDRYCVLLGPVPSFTSVMRVRLQPEEIEETVAEVRRIVSERRHVEPVWWIGGSATPRDLVDRLLALGFRPNEEPGWEPRCTAMALVEPPPAANGIFARRVGSLAEFRAADEISGSAFGAPEEDQAELRAIDEQRFAAERRGEAPATYLAWADGKPVASARALFTDAGVLLIGGGTLPEARGRGAYRALVRARWDDAVAAGTPALVVRAGAMSKPILERLGFQSVTDIDVLVDAAA